MAKRSDIQLGKDLDAAPPTRCPRCSKELHMMIDAWKPDITKIVRTNCPFCGVEMYAALMIVIDTSLQGVVGAVAAVANLFNPKNVTLVDSSGKPH